MSRTLVFTALFSLALGSAQAQFSHGGPPASVVSPTADGRQHGVPASVLSPTPLPPGVNPPPGFRVHGPLRRFGNPSNHRTVFVPVPLFYSYYTDGYPSVADPYVPEVPADPAPAPAQQAADRRNNDDDLRAAYLQGARDALRDQETRSRDRAPEPEPKPAPAHKTDKPADPPADKTPATVFIFKDGHQLETRNYAIMGQTIFDFSGKTLRKIQLEEIDAVATAKANDDRGVPVKLQ